MVVLDVLIVSVVIWGSVVNMKSKIPYIYENKRLGTPAGYILPSGYITEDKDLVKRVQKILDDSYTRNAAVIDSFKRQCKMLAEAREEG